MGAFTPLKKLKCLPALNDGFRGSLRAWSAASPQVSFEPDAEVIEL
jgi:hypothetical protein